MPPQSSRIRVRNFKSYGDPGLEFDEVKFVNIVIGRNNTGKSSLLDAIEHLCAGSEVNPVHYHAGNKSVFSVVGTLPDQVIRYQFSDTSSGGWIGGNHWERVGQHLIGEKFEVSILTGGQQSRIVSYSPSQRVRDIVVATGKPFIEEDGLSPILQDMVQSITNPLNGYSTIRLTAERDISPESRQKEIALRPNGVGLTNLIAQIVTSAKYDSRIVEHNMLSTINSILYPDIHIDGIRVQEHDNQSWEIFLEQSGKGFISLSNSGSGLKTVILTVAALQTLKELNDRNLERYIFLLEELENNLHPAMQRRLLKFVSDFVIENKSAAFITTHSSAVIDMFSRSENAQIIHVGNDEDGHTRASVSDTHISRMGILDDLDVRASDILQSNGVVWVEGPSDRIYFNRWMDLISDGRLVEGVHYQCVFYGGRLLSHLSAEPEDTSGNGVKILRVARNAMLLMDSDIGKAGDQINATKARLKAELDRVGGLVWISDGREIENYIPPSVFAKINPKLNVGIGRYDEIEGFLENTLGGEQGRLLIRSKATFAETVAALTEKKDIESMPDLLKNLFSARSEIARWNGLASEFL